MLDREQARVLMGAALVEARIAGGRGEVPAGAVVADLEGRIIAGGHNRCVNLNDPTAHAEIMALRRAAAVMNNYRLAQTILVTTLEPCPMCLMAAIHARVSLVIYGAPEPRWGSCGSLFDLVTLPGLNHRPEIQGGLMAGECASLVREFFLQRRQEGRPQHFCDHREPGCRRDGTPRADGGSIR
jgi:tRNA(adenine34) deaminase